MPNARDRQGVTDQLFAVKSAENLSARVRCHYEKGRRLDLQICFTPNFPLQLHASVKFLDRVTTPHNDGSRHRAAPAATSPLLARSQSASICARGTSANSLPLCRARRSISRN